MQNNALDQGRITETIDEVTFRRAVALFQEENPGMFWAGTAARVRGEYIARARSYTLDAVPVELTVSDYQVSVDQWLQNTFPTFRHNSMERALRFLEEALELFQAAGGREKDASHLIDYVFSRPRGDLSQEIGGVLNTLAALATCHGVSLSLAAEDGLKDCWGRSDDIKRKQAMKAEAGVSEPLFESDAKSGSGPMRGEKAPTDTFRDPLSDRLDLIEKLLYSVLDALKAKNRTKA